MKDFAGLLAVFMSLVIPITAIIAGCIISVGNKKREKEIRQLIIENDLDIERAKLLIEKPQKKDNNILLLSAKTQRLITPLSAMPTNRYCGFFF